MSNMSPDVEYHWVGGEMVPDEESIQPNISQTEVGIFPGMNKSQHDRTNGHNLIIRQNNASASTLCCGRCQSSVKENIVDFQQHDGSPSKTSRFRDKTFIDETGAQSDLNNDVYSHIKHMQHKIEQHRSKCEDSLQLDHKYRTFIGHSGLFVMRSKQNGLRHSMKAFIFLLLIGILNTPLETSRSRKQCLSRLNFRSGYVDSSPMAQVECDWPARIVNISEIDPAGTRVMNMSIQNNVTWDFSLSEPELNEYFTFGPNQSLQLAILELTKPVDIEEIYDRFNLDLTAVLISLTCNRPAAQPVSDTTFLVVKAVNEFAPVFNQTSIVLSVKETFPLNDPIITLINWASDEDHNSARREISGFVFDLPPTVDTQIDGTRWLQMSNSYDGVITVENALDFESLPTSRKYIVVGLIVRDAGGLTGTSTLTLSVLDDDDLPPEFFHANCASPCRVIYSISINPNQTGVMTGIKPAPIQARDGDTLNYDITYHIIQGPDGYETYLSMDQTTGELTVLKELRDLNLGNLVLIIEAREVSALQLSTKTTLLINVEGVAAAGSVVRAGSDDDILIVAIVLAVVVFIIVIVLVIGMIYFRKKFKKAVHPESRGPILREEANPAQDSPDSRSMTDNRRTLNLSDEVQFMRGEEEMTTWVPVTSSKDIVDLSDEETLRMKKKNGVPPNSTMLNNRDSAYEGSDKKSSSDGSHRDNDYSVESDYAELDTLDVPPKKRLGNAPTTEGNVPDKNSALTDNERRAVNNVYGDSPSNIPLSAAPPPPGRDTNGEENNIEDTYLTPKETGSKPPFAPSVFINKAFRGDDDGEKVTSFSNRNPDKANIEIDKVQNNPLYVEDGDENTEYSIPPSARSSYANRPLPIPEDIEGSRISSIDYDDKRPDVPPRHRVRPISGVQLSTDDHEDDVDPYAKVDKRKERSPSQPDPLDADQSSSADNSPRMKASSVPLQAPSRKKRPKKRTKLPHAPEEDVYDGTKDYEDLEVDSGFYTDTNKSRIKRSTRLPVMKPDPNDTRYWVTVSNDY